MKIFVLFILILLPIDNLYFQITGIKIRCAEIFGLLLLAQILFKMEFRSKLFLPEKSKYLIYFFIISSISLIYTDVGPVKYGIIYQLHQIIQFVCVVSVYYIFQSKPYKFHFNYFEKKIFYFFDLILLYGLIQVFFYNVLGISLTFGMDSWRTSIISYRQDIIDPLYDVFANAPWLRPSSVFAEPVILGLFCTWMFVVSLFHLIKGNLNFNWKYRIIMSMLLLVFVASRASILGISVILIYFFILSKKVWIRIIPIGIIMALVITVIDFSLNLNIIGGFFEGRFDKTTTYADPRMVIFADQITGFWDSPILGNGRGMTRALSDKVMPILFQTDEPTGGWSFWITLLYDSGLAGFISLIIYFFVLYNIAKTNVRIFYRSKSEIYFWALISIMITGIFFGPLTGGIFWLAILLFYLSTINRKNKYLMLSLKPIVMKGIINKSNGGQMKSQYYSN